MRHTDRQARQTHNSQRRRCALCDCTLDVGLPVELVVQAEAQVCRRFRWLYGGFVDNDREELVLTFVPGELELFYIEEACMGTKPV